VAGKTKETFRIHLGLFLAELICIPAFLFEVKRALGGNTLSWAYVVEWPLLGGYAVYMWRKMLREARGETPAAPVVEQSDDPQLRAWNEYLAALHQRPTSSPQSDEPENLAD
jgi:heme oxygenase